MSKENNDEYAAHQFHRDHDLDETGVSQVVIERFVKYRLPLLLQIKQEMDDGRKLSEGELELMVRIVDRAHQINRFAHTYPKNKELVARVISLVEEITEEALANETKSDPASSP